MDSTAAISAVLDAVLAQRSASQTATLAAIEQSAAPFSPMDVGRYVQARVVQADTGSPTLAIVDGRLLNLNFSDPVSGNQTMQLQVMQVEPQLQFRLVNPGSGNVSTDMQVVVSTSARQLGASDTASAPAPTAVTINLPASTTNTPSGGIAQSLTGVLRQAFEGNPGTALWIPSASAQEGTAGPIPLQAAQTDTATNTAPLPAGNTGASASFVTSGSLNVVASGRTNPFATGQIGSVSGNDSHIGPPLTPMAQNELRLAITPNASDPMVASTHAGQNLASVNGATLSAAAAWQTPPLNPQAELDIWPDSGGHDWERAMHNAWQAQLKLAMPKLGPIEAQIAWSTTGVSVRVTAQDKATQEQLHTASTEFVETLRSLGIKVHGLGIHHV